jgi:uncharacterized lipoprotein YmbA
MRFDGVVGGDVALDVRWVLLEGSDPKILSARRSRIVKSAGTDGHRSLVAGMSEAVGELCREIAAAVKEATS